MSSGSKPRGVTPNTDERTVEMRGREWVPAAFARDMERELSGARSAVVASVTDHEKVAKELDGIEGVGYGLTHSQLVAVRCARDILRATRSASELPAELFDSHAVFLEADRAAGPDHTIRSHHVSAVLDAVVRLIRKGRTTNNATDSRANRG